MHLNASQKSVADHAGVNNTRRGAYWASKARAAVSAILDPANRIALLCVLGFAVLWVAELFIVQSITLVPRQEVGPRFAFWAPKIRFVLDTCFVLAICLAVRPLWLIPVAVMTFCIHVGLIAYEGYFQRPISMLTILSNWREGASVSRYVFSWVPPLAGTLLAASLVTKITLLVRARKVVIPRTVRIAGVALFVLVYGGLFLVTLKLDPLRAVLQRRGVARLGVIRGYTGPWLAELYYLNSPLMLANAIERSKIKSDTLTPIEAKIDVHSKLAVIQVESLDYNVLGLRVNGKEVTPFLNQLRDRSLFYKVKGYHVLGSADADFTMLAGGPPAMSVLNYNLPGFPYDNALPKFLGERGFKTTAYHGNWGQFYNRRPAFEKMGFESILFREDFEKEGGGELDTMGVRDKDVLARSTLDWREVDGPECHFIITLTSHTPYVSLRPEEHNLIPHPRNSVERYFNHMHYVDECLRDYVTSLGSDATVVIYSDHPTELGNDAFTPAREKTIEFVPVFIYDTSDNLAQVQQTRASGLATNGQLKILDIISYLRKQISTSFEPQSESKHPEISVPQSAELSGGRR